MADFNLDPGGSYTLRANAKNISTKAGIPWAARLRVVSRLQIGSIDLVSADEVRDFLANESLSFEYPFTVPQKSIGQEGGIGVLLKAPDGSTIGSAMATVASPYPVTFENMRINETLVWADWNYQQVNFYWTVNAAHRIPTVPGVGSVSTRVELFVLSPTKGWVSVMYLFHANENYREAESPRWYYFPAGRSSDMTYNYIYLTDYGCQENNYYPYRFEIQAYDPAGVVGRGMKEGTLFLPRYVP